MDQLLPNSVASGRRRNVASKERFSAIAATIRFLGQLPAKTRAKVREIVIREDHDSSVMLECHAHGLIPFRQEKPRLKIEMWGDLRRRIQAHVAQRVNETLLLR